MWCVNYTLNFFQMSARHGGWFKLDGIYLSFALVDILTIIIYNIFIIVYAAHVVDLLPNKIDVLQVIFRMEHFITI